MPLDRTPFGAADLLGGTPDEKCAAVETYISYSGRYEMAGDRVRHHIDVSLFPNWTGVTQERILSLTGDTLRLSTPPLLIKGKVQTAHLVWKRARSALTHHLAPADLKPQRLRHPGRIVTSLRCYGRTTTRISTFQRPSDPAYITFEEKLAVR